MFIANVSHDDIISQEGSLEDYLGRLPNWEKKVENAKQIVLSKLKNSGRKIRLLNTPLIFVDEDDTDTYIITNSGSWTSDKSSKDTVERFLFVFELSTLASGTLEYKLQGSDESEEGEEVWTDVVIGSTDQVGDFAKRISHPFAYYQLVLSGSGSRTFKAYLVEDVFFLPVLFLAIAFIYLDLKSMPNSNWEEKFNTYMELHNQAFESLVFSYDEDESATIESNEMESKSIRLLR